MFHSVRVDPVRLLYLPTVNGLLMLTNPRQQNLIVHVGFFQLRISLFQLSLFSPLCSEILYYAVGIAEASLPGVLLVLDNAGWLGSEGVLTGGTDCA